MKQKRSLPLADVILASPCDVPWEVMVGDNRVRHCLECKRDVHNLSAMTSGEVEAFLEAAQAMGARGEHKPCIALFQRTDGTILTSDCPVGVRKRRMRSLVASMMGVGMASLMAFTALALLKGDELRHVINHDRSGPPYITTVAAPPKPMTMGHVRLDGTPDTEIFENGARIGTVPQAMPVVPGTHVYVFKHEGESKTMTVVVNDRDLSHVYVDFAPKPEIHRPMTAGRMPHPNVRGGMMKGGI